MITDVRFSSQYCLWDLGNMAFLSPDPVIDVWVWVSVNCKTIIFIYWLEYSEKSNYLVKGDDHLSLSPQFYEYLKVFYLISKSYINDGSCWFTWIFAWCHLYFGLPQKWPVFTLHFMVFYDLNKWLFFSCLQVSSFRNSFFW